jgi:hypothetical protein
MMDNKSKPIYWIIAGHHQEFADYFRDIINNHPERLDQYDYQYVNDPSILRGHRNIQGSFIGTWYLKPEATQIYAIIVSSHIAHAENTYSQGLFKARMVLEHHGKPIGAVGAP